MLLLLNKVREERLGGETSPTFGQWGSNTGHGKIDDLIYSIVYLLSLFVY